MKKANAPSSIASTCHTGDAAPRTGGGAIPPRPSIVHDHSVAATISRSIAQAKNSRCGSERRSAGEKPDGPPAPGADDGGCTLRTIGLTPTPGPGLPQ